MLTPAGNVPITNFVKREPSEKRDAISRIDGQRVIQIQAAMAVNPETGSEYLATDLENDFKQWMAQQDFVPSSVKWRLRGANEEAEEAAAFLGARHDCLVDADVHYSADAVQQPLLHALDPLDRDLVHHRRIARHGFDRPGFLGDYDRQRAWSLWPVLLLIIPLC